jgi:hypothetical protein
VSTARPDAGVATKSTFRAPNISHSTNTTNFEGLLAVANHINTNGQLEGEVNPARSTSGGTAFTTAIPDDFQLWIPPLLRNGHTSAFITNPPGFFQAHQPWEPLRFSPTPICPTCVKPVSGQPITTCERCGLIVCHDEETDCGRILETLLSDSNNFETGYPDKYFYC